MEPDAPVDLLLHFLTSILFFDCHQGSQLQSSERKDLECDEARPVGETIEDDLEYESQPNFRNEFSEWHIISSSRWQAVD